MSDTTALVAVAALQIVISFVGARYLLARRPNLLLMPALLLPSVAAFLGLWMAFGMGQVTDLGAMAVAALVVTTVILLVVGAFAALAAKLLYK
jgi:hypothetical protein